MFLGFYLIKKLNSLLSFADWSYGFFVFSDNLGFFRGLRLDFNSIFLFSAWFTVFPKGETDFRGVLAIFVQLALVEMFYLSFKMGIFLIEILLACVLKGLTDFLGSSLGFFFSFSWGFDD